MTGRGGGAAGTADYDVFLHLEKSVGVKWARQVLEAVIEDRRVVLVSLDGPTPFTRKECAESARVAFMLARDLCVCPTHHTLVPRHERVAAPPDGVDAHALPRMLDTDRIAQYYDWGPGTIVRVWRRFGGHEPVPYFRRVVATASST